MQSFRNLKKLATFLRLDKLKRKELYNSPFPLNLPFRIAKKIEKNNLKDPLFLQFVPLKKEKKKQASFTRDPLEEKKFTKGAFLKKYKNRALLITSGCCAMNCRFCFRKSSSQFNNETIELIKEDKSLAEIILSGGDPLSLSNKKLHLLFQQLKQIKHLKRIRIHTRFIIGFPERINKGLLKIFKDTDKQIYIVIHVNHPKELDEEIFKALGKVQKLKIPILTQSVLLKGVNDSIKVLKELFELLIDHAIIPYYLHQLDKIEGASHFEVPVRKGLKLMKELQSLLPGYAIPKYVREIANKESKTILRNL